MSSLFGVSEPPPPPRFFLLCEMLFKDRSLPVAQAALDRLSTAGARVFDGIPASVLRVFSDLFCPRRLEEIKMYMNGGTPSYDLLMGLMYMISKTKNSVVVSHMRPICVGNTRLKWITTVLLIQVEDVLAHLVHPSQVGSIRGRQMQNHLWSLLSLCEVLPSYVTIGG